VIRAVLFDLDGVLRQFDPGHIGRVEADAGLPPGTLDAIAFDVSRLAGAVTGKWTFEQWQAAVASELGERFGINGRPIARRFFGLGATTVDAEVLALLREVRAKVPVGLLTNASSRLATELEELGLTGEVDVVCNSWELGVAKPDRRVYDLAAERMGCRTDECFFTDDRPINVAGARAAGMTAHHFTGVAGLRAALEAAAIGIR
jgi:putative hydrolase of the HAD superfamily